ncbi:MAG: oligomeric, coiled-coil, peripheral membrane protein [Trizodia sp. TS-e1964]|nr:MAG: oligomeric, coiled-coil, peripheral membrane protein [Trizodia sp. TS-e1964]
MTPRGKQIKHHMLMVEREIFVFDRQHVTPPTVTSPKATVAHTPLPPDPALRDVPEAEDPHAEDLEAWRNLFKARRVWAFDLANQNASLADASEKHLMAVDIMEQAVNVAVTNLDNHVKMLEQKNTEAQAWAGDLLKGQEAVVTALETNLTRLNAIPAKESFLKFVSDHGHFKGHESDSAVLASLIDFVDVGDVRHSGKVAHSAWQQFKSKAADLRGSVERIVASRQDLINKINKELAASMVGRNEESKRLMEEVEVITKKVNSDYEHVLGLDDSPKSVTQASRMAQLNSKEYLPSLRDLTFELNGVLRRAVEERNRCATLALQYLQSVSAIESMLANVNNQIAAFDVDPEGSAAFSHVNLIGHLPTTYGSLLVESVRRREWSDKVKSDSSMLAEELAVFKEEEERRRKKWQKNTGDLLWLDSTDERALSVEINLHGTEKPWPQATRQEVGEYIDFLKEVDGTDEAVKDLSVLIKELDRPTKQQSKRAKAFKMGSMHEAALGRSSLLLRGDDDLVLTLQEEKSKLEDRLKSSDSRIRRLEDLLHRQSQISRVASGNIFQISSPISPEAQYSPSTNLAAAASPRLHDNLSRRSSVSSRRFSSTQSPEEKALAQRILVLEAELSTEREFSAGLRNEVSIQNETEIANKAKIEEAIAAKKDIMKNMDEQQREFANERKYLEDERKTLKEELEKLKTQFEAAGDQLERVLVSRENEKATTQQLIEAHTANLEQMRQKSYEEAQIANDRITILQDDAHTNTEEIKSLRKLVEDYSHSEARSDEKIRSLEAEKGQIQEMQHNHASAIDAANQLLSPSHPFPPGDIPFSIKAIVDIALASSTRAKDLEANLAAAKLNQETFSKRVQALENDLGATREKLGAEEMESFSLRETLAEEKARLSTIRLELDDEKRVLLEKLINGESISQALQQRIAEYERKSGTLSGDLAAKQAQISMLEDQLQSWRRKKLTAEVTSESAASRLATRTLRAEDLTQRLYTQNDRMSSLLESLGFTVSRCGDVMVISRAPRASAASAESDANTSIIKSISASAPSKSLPNEPPRKLLQESSSNLEVLSWTQAEDSEGESEKYAAYLDAISTFDFDAFAEAITRRVKETELLARKWQKEARAYRDKFHRAQLEAHEKIAFRSFKEGDLALFLPTRNQATRPWAAFNVGAPHYFLREQDSHKLRTRDWLLARIGKVEERVVDIAKSMSGLSLNPPSDRASIGGQSDGGVSFEDENPFDLSDGLRWYLLDATEEKPGAPSTPGLGKSTVASANIDAKGSIRISSKRSSIGNVASQTLSKSLDSRRSSSNSKRTPTPTATPTNATSPTLSQRATNSTSAQQQQQQAPSNPFTPQPLTSRAGPPLGLGLNTQDLPINNEVRDDLSPHIT